MIQQSSCLPTWVAVWSHTAFCDSYVNNGVERVSPSYTYIKHGEQTWFWCGRLVCWILLEEDIKNTASLNSWGIVAIFHLLQKGWYRNADHHYSHFKKCKRIKKERSQSSSAQTRWQGNTEQKKKSHIHSIFTWTPYSVRTFCPLVQVSHELKVSLEFKGEVFNT